MALSTQQQKKLEMFLKLGDEIGATRYLQQELNISADDALLAVEKLKPAVKPLPREFIQDFNAKKNSLKNSKLGSRVGLVFMIIGL